MISLKKVESLGININITLFQYVKVVGVAY